MPFDLTTNPFFLLGTTVRARRDEIVEAYEVSVSRGMDEAILSRAQQTVLTPRLRVAAELRWLFGVAPKQARQITERLERGEFADAAAILESLPGLDRANFAAHMCARSGNAQYLYALLQSYELFTVETVASNLAAVHAVADFPVPDQKFVQESLASLRSDHAKAGLAVVCQATHPGAFLTTVVETFLDSPNEGTRLLLHLIVREYDSWSIPALGEVRRRIERAIANDRQSGSLSGPKEVAALLAEWDSLSQPVQLMELSKGHEESRSRQIYETVRDFELTLANDESRYRDALVVARALQAAFPELPSAAEKLADDIEKLEELAESAELEEIVGPLHAALESARADLSTFVSEVVSRGFGPAAVGLAGELYDAFSNAAVELAETGNQDMPWAAVRGFAIDLHNEHDQAEAAAALVRGLISFDGAQPSSEVVEALAKDEAAVTRTMTWAKILRLQASDPQTSVLVESLLPTSQGEERTALLGIQNKIREEKIRAARVRLGWTSAAICLVALWIYAGTQEEVEALPPPGVQRSLSRAETRGCVFQGERLQLLYTIVSQSPVDRDVDTYNRLLADYRARCEDKRSSNDDLNAAQAAASGRQVKLLEEAREMLWGR